MVSNLWQVKDVLFEPVRKTQDAMFFFKSADGTWMPCGPKQSGAIQITMQDLAEKGLAEKVCILSLEAVFSDDRRQKILMERVCKRAYVSFFCFLFGHETDYPTAHLKNRF